MSTIATSTLPYALITCYRKPSFSGISRHSRERSHHGFSFPANRSHFHRLTTGPRTSQTGNRSKITEFIVYNSDPTTGGDLFPFADIVDHWKNWIPGIMLTVIVPFFTNKWGPFAKFKAEEIDKVEETADRIADMVEEAAEKVEKVVEDIVEDLPEGKLKTVLNAADNLAKEVAKDAQLVEDIVAKMDEMEENVESIVKQVSGNGPNVKAKVDKLEA